MNRYQPIESIRWVRDDGRAASAYGAFPWMSESERSRWRMEPTGWTVFDASHGTVGCGQPPWKTREEAQRHCDRWNAEHQERLDYAEKCRTDRRESGTCDRCDRSGTIVDVWAGPESLLEVDDGRAYCRTCYDAIEDDSVRYEEMRQEGGFR